MCSSCDGSEDRALDVDVCIINGWGDCVNAEHFHYPIGII